MYIVEVAEEDNNLRKLGSGFVRTDTGISYSIKNKRCELLQMLLVETYDPEQVKITPPFEKFGSSLLYTCATKLIDKTRLLKWLTTTLKIDERFYTMFMDVTVIHRWIKSLNATTDEITVAVPFRQILAQYFEIVEPTEHQIQVALNVVKKVTNVPRIRLVADPRLCFHLLKNIYLDIYDYLY